MPTEGGVTMLSVGESVSKDMPCSAVSQSSRSSF